MRRRALLKGLAATLAAMALTRPRQVGATLLASPLAANRLRPPGAVAEDIFAGKCIRCGRCVEVCPYHSITLLDIRHGLHAGTPLVLAEKNPCYLCMKCVEVCPTGTLRRIPQEATRMGLAVLNRHACHNWTSAIMCRTCYDICPLKNRAIRLAELRPVVEENVCTGCGMCVNACPVTAADGSKAINIFPIYAHATELR
ncbi:MAG: nitrate reductase [Desulfobulbaceae bacterium A2]|nr:MAG: nitrate reductase [Desulfobulbaceae bacterium A2]